jgi:hypothetical protein
MNFDPPGKQELSGKMPRRDSVELNVSGDPKIPGVPVFSCIVYVSTNAGGGVQARVANLPGLGCTAASERDALGKIIPAFKRRVGELMQSGTPIPWIEPPAPAKPGEQTRFIPVHL